MFLCRTNVPRRVYGSRTEPDFNDASVQCDGGRGGGERESVDEMRNGACGGTAAESGERGLARDGAGGSKRARTP